MENMGTYEERIEEGLTGALAGIANRETADLHDLKLIVFSDHHRGCKDRADDFRDCMPAYHAALEYYLAAGYTLYLLGDVEELWENRPRAVVTAYRESLRIERHFILTGKYRRLVGNHDDEWRYHRKVEKYLRRFITDERGRYRIAERHLIDVRDGVRDLGALLFVHGHQGTFDADRYSRVSRFFVRFVWRPLQRTFRLKSTTPATDYALRLKHERVMHAWATRQSGLVLIAGHTHHPVFSSASDECHARSGSVEYDVACSTKPCYFNTGCCSFSDGEITGLEISDGIIRLVRWPGEAERFERTILKEDYLERILARCRQAMQPAEQSRTPPIH